MEVFLMKRLTVIAAVLAALLLTACGGNATASPTPAPSAPAPVAEAEATPEPARDNVIISLSADISNLDPANTANQPDIQVLRNIHDTLIMETANGFEPWLAESYEMAEDGLSYTFKLHQGVLFHNGDELKASDVVFTYERAMESPYVNSTLTAIEKVTAEDDYTVRFDLLNEYAPFLSAHELIYIVSERAVTEGGETYAQNPVGTGPYKFAGNTVGVEVLLTRHDDYFKGPAPIKDVILKVILDPSTLSIAVESGDVDLALNIPPGDLERLGGVSELAVTDWESKSLYFIILNSKSEKFGNPLVRQAVSHTLDRQTMIDMADDGFGVLANSIWNKFTFGYSPDVTLYPYDIAKAKELMAQAGYPDGFEISLKTIGGNFESQALILQSNLAQIGIKANIELIDQAAFLNDVFSGNYEMGNLGMALGADADGWSTVFTTDGGMNMAAISDPELDSLFAEAGRLSDSDARLAIYKQIAQKINDDSAFIPLYFAERSYVHSNNLQLGWIGSSGEFNCSELKWAN
jgi:peptide/nickel transport system substrate-binding protein